MRWMISGITGQLHHVHDDRVHLSVGPILYELLVPASDVPMLQMSLNDQLTFHTIMYLEGDPNRGNLEPRLIGFLRADDREFFELFTTVKGIGPRTALRALTVRVGDIAQAIEGKDSRFLMGLKGIGRRTAELIMAELSGKVQKFALAAGARPVTAPARRSSEEEDAIGALIALGERRVDAEQLLDRARTITPGLKSTDSLVREMLRLRTVR